jgi:hypothetical protein
MKFQPICMTFIASTLIFSLTVSVLLQQTWATPKDNQTIPLPKSTPSSNVTMRNTTTSTVPSPGFVPDSRGVQNTDEFDMTIQLTPYTQGQALRDRGWYEVLGWQLALSDPSSLCPTQNCTFQLEEDKWARNTLQVRDFCREN